MERRKTPGAPQVEPATTDEVSPVAARTVVTAFTRFVANLIPMVAVVVPTTCTLVKVGVAARALVERQMPPSLPPVLKPATPASRILGSAGSKARSVTPRLPPLAGCTVSLVKVGETAMALVERYNPRLGRLELMTDGRESAPMPPIPDTVETKTMLSSVGLTRTWVIERPVKTSVPWPWRLNGPSRVGVVSAFLMMYKPTPKKLSPERLPSPVPTKMVVGARGSMATEPIARDWASSISGVHEAPPSRER